MICKIIAVYAVIGVVLAELVVRTEKKRQKRPTLKQYLNLVLIWPVVLYIARKRW